jgi:hypothetical protein
MMLIAMLAATATCQAAPGGASETQHAQVARSFMTLVSQRRIDEAAKLVEPDADYVDVYGDDTMSIEAALDQALEDREQATLTYLDRVGDPNTIAIKSRVRDADGAEDQITVFKMGGGCITGIYQF